MGSYRGMREMDSHLHTGVGEVLQYDESEKDQPIHGDESVVCYTPNWAMVKSAAMAELEKLPGKQSAVSEWLKEVIGHAERADGGDDLSIQFCW
jgi:hypothetical protein